MGHFGKYCRQPRKESINSILANIDCSLAESVIDLKINNRNISALLDTGASENFMDRKLATKLGLKVKKEIYGSVALADRNQKSKIEGKTKADVIFDQETYHDISFTLLDNLVAEVIIGLKLLKRHKSVTLQFIGTLKPLIFKSSYNKKLSVACSNIEYPTLFPGVSEKTKAVRIPTRRYSKDDRMFI